MFGTPTANTPWDLPLTTKVGYGESQLDGLRI